MKKHFLLGAVGVLLALVAPSQTTTINEVVFNSYKIGYLDLKENGACIVAGKKTAGMSQVGSNSVSLLVLDKEGSVKLNKEFTIDSREHIRYLSTADVQGKYIYVVTFYVSKEKTGFQDAIISRFDLEGNMLQKKYAETVFGTPLHFYANSTNVTLLCSDNNFEMKCVGKNDECVIRLFSFSAADLAMTEGSHDLSPAAEEGKIYWKPVRIEEASATFYRVKSADPEARTIDIEFRQIDNRGKQLSSHETRIATKQWLPYNTSGYLTETIVFSREPTMVNDDGDASAYMAGYCFIKNDPEGKCFWAHGRLASDKKGKQTDGFFLACITNEYMTEFVNEYIDLRGPSGYNRIHEPMTQMKLHFTGDGITFIANDVLGTYYFSVEKKAAGKIQVQKIENGPGTVDGYYCQNKNFIREDKTVRSQASKKAEELNFCIGSRQYYIINKWAEHKLLIYSK